MEKLIVLTNEQTQTMEMRRLKTIILLKVWLKSVVKVKNEYESDEAPENIEAFENDNQQGRIENGGSWCDSSLRNTW